MTEDLSRRRLLTMGVAAGTAVGIAGIPFLTRCVGAKQAALFLDYPMSFDINVQSSFRGKLDRLYTTSYQPEKYVGDYHAISRFLESPVTLISEKPYAAEGIETIPIDRINHTWLRDLFVFTDRQVLASPIIALNNTRGLFGSSNNASQVRESLEVLAASEGLEVAVAPCPFEGGQILRAGDHTLVPDYWLDIRNLQFIAHIDPDRYYGLRSKEDIEYFYNSVFGPTLFVPNLVNELASFSGHLDMYVTPVKSDTIFVGDIALADKILKESGQLSEIEKQIYQRISTGENDIFGQTGIDEADPKPVFQQVLDRTAEYLSQFYTVKRFPFGLLNIQGRLCFMSYNNALVSHDDKKVVLPNFGVDVLDTFAKKQYEQEGYTTLTLSGTEGMLRRYGPHCLYLEKRSV